MAVGGVSRCACHVKHAHDTRRVGDGDLEFLLRDRDLEFMLGGVMVTEQWLASECRAVLESLGDDPECCEFDLRPEPATTSL